MTSKSTNRAVWHRTNNGTWSLSLGTRGTRVRLFEMTKGGVFYRDAFVDGQKKRRSLHTRDRREAERFGKLLLSELLSGKVKPVAGVVSLGSLWGRFRCESAAWLDNSERSKKDDERSAKVLLAYFRRERDVTTLSENDQIAFQNARLRGGIVLEDGEETKSVRARAVQCDILLLKTMLRWATRIRVGGGERLLSFNPLDGVQVIREKNELRPVATWERFQKTREAIAGFISEAKDEGVRFRWLKIDLALVLAEATGRRLGSIRQLRWADVDFDSKQIRWRAEADKKGKEWVVPVPDALADELRRARKTLSAISGWVFASQKDPEKPMDRHLFDRWLTEAERRAELPKLAGGLWHPYRRKWATERKDLPIVDVMAAGGWTDSGTILRSYQHADHETLLRVMNEPRKLFGAIQPSETPKVG